MAVGDLITNKRIELSLKSPKEKRSMNVGFLTDNATESKVKNFFNVLCDIEIKNIKFCSVYEVTEVKGVVSQADFRDVSLTIQYDFEGQRIATNKFYLPRVPKNIQFQQIQDQVKILFGESAVISGASGI